MLNDYQAPEKRYGATLFDFAQSIRNIAFEIDENPRCIKKYYELPALRFLINERDSTTLARTKYLEAFSYGDCGTLLASPGASLSGLVMRELALPEQTDLFYSELQSNKMTTFFALTEPKRGSDAYHIETRLQKTTDHAYCLSGVKSFFGNGAVADMGIVLAKISESPVGLRAIWMTRDVLTHSTVSRKLLPMFCLRGAKISVMQFQNTPIPDENILGGHLSACNNGLLSIFKVFNQFRPGVGALAIGQAQAVYDICYRVTKSEASFFRALNTELNMARNLLHHAASLVDKDPFNNIVVSIAKANATKTAEYVIEQCMSCFTIESLLDNPYVLKAARDMYCWEFMEGTTAIQKKQIKWGVHV